MNVDNIANMDTWKLGQGGFRTMRSNKIICTRVHMHGCNYTAVSVSTNDTETSFVVCWQSLNTEGL